MASVAFHFAGWNGITAEKETIGSPGRGRAVLPRVWRSVASDHVHDHAPQFGGKPRALLGALESQLGAHRKCCEPFAFLGRLAAGASEFGLPARHQSKQRRRAEGILRLFARQAETPEKVGRKDIASRGRTKASLHHIASAPLPGPFQKMRARQFAHMVVHLLAGKPQSASQACRRIGTGQRLENSQPQRMQQRRGTRHLRYEVPRGFLRPYLRLREHAVISQWTSIFVKTNYFVKEVMRSKSTSITRSVGVRPPPCLNRGYCAAALLLSQALPGKIMP